MKKMIITQEQLRKINEAMAVGVADNLGDVQTTYNDIQAKSSSGGPVQIDIASNTDGPAYTMTAAELHQKGTTPLPNNTGSLRVTENTKRYTKRQVDLARVIEMRKRGEVFSKKKLNEMLLGGK